MSPSASGLPSSLTVPEIETSELAHPESSRPAANQHHVGCFMAKTPFSLRRQGRMTKSEMTPCSSKLWRDFPARNGPEAAPDAEVDALFDKVHGAVPPEGIHAAGVPAARGGRHLLFRADGAGQVQLRTVRTAAFGEEDVRAGAVRRRAGVNLAQAGHIDPNRAAEILGRFGLGYAGEVLAKHHRVACP